MSRVLILAAVLLVSLSSRTASAYLVNGNFESLGAPLYDYKVWGDVAIYPTIGWDSVSWDVIEIWNYAAGFGGAEESSLFCEINSYGQDTLQQTVNLTAGSYDLRFYHRARNSNGEQISVFVGGDDKGSFEGITTDWTRHVIPFDTPGGSVTIAFRSDLIGDAGNLLDQVSLLKVPEPATIVMVSLGLVVLTLRRGRVKPRI